MEILSLEECRAYLKDKNVTLQNFENGLKIYNIIFYRQTTRCQSKSNLNDHLNQIITHNNDHIIYDIVCQKNGIDYGGFIIIPTFKYKNDCNFQLLIKRAYISNKLKVFS